MVVAELAGDLNINTIIALGAVGLAGIAIVIKLLDKGVSLREHNEFRDGLAKRLDEIQTRQDQRVTVSALDDYKASIEQRGEIRRVQYEDLKRATEDRVMVREFAQWRDEWVKQVQRDFDRVEDDLRLIDSTKPSAGELQEAMKAVDARVTHLEAMIRDVRRGNGNGK